MTDQKQDEGRASRAGFEPGPVSSDPTPEETQNQHKPAGETTAAAGAPDEQTAGGGQHGRPEDDKDDGHS